MFPYDQVNYLAVVLAAVAAYVLGMLWYWPTVFGAAWLHSNDPVTGSEMPVPEMTPPVRFGVAVGHVVARVTAGLLTAWVVALVIYGMAIDTMVGGAVAGLILGVGLVATSLLTDYLVCGRRLSLFWIQSGYRLAAMLSIGTILGACREYSDWLLS